MIDQMDDCGPGISRDQIQRVESLTGTAFPDDYITFLMRYNGGRPSPNAYPIEGLSNNPFGVIQVFFGIDYPITSCNLDWNYHVHKSRIPSNLFPIACDDGGDLICISLSGTDENAVFFWDRHTEPAEPSYKNVYRIAPSFSEFIERIRGWPK